MPRLTVMQQGAILVSSGTEFESTVVTHAR